MIAASFFCVGVMSGLAEALLLQRSARGERGVLLGAARILAPFVVLIAAAVSDQLLWGAMGWGTSFLLTGALIFWRWS